MPVFQNPCFVVKKTVILRKNLVILRPNLADCGIQKLTSYRCAFFDQIQIIRTEENNIQRPRKFIRCLFYSVYKDPFGNTRLNLNRYRLLSFMAGYVCQYFRGGITEIDKLLIKSCTKALSVGKQINSFDQIGLPLRIASVNNIRSAAETDGIPLIITESRNRKPVNSHELLLFSAPEL